MSRRTIDYAGAALLATSVTLLMLAAGQTGVAGRGAWVGLACAGAIGFGWWLVRVERRAAEPMVPLDLLADRMVASIAGIGLLVGAAMFSAISYVPLLVQEGLEGTAVEAGRALTPLVLGWVVVAVIAGRLVHRTGYRPMVLGGLSLVTVAFAGLATISADAPGWVLQADLAVMGMGMGMAMLSLVLAMQSAVARRHLGVATVVRPVHPQHRRGGGRRPVRRGHRGHDRLGRGPHAGPDARGDPPGLRPHRRRHRTRGARGRPDARRPRR